METYSLNQNPIPQVPMTAEERHRFMNLSIVAVAIALIIGILYWWTTTGNSIAPASVDTQAELRAQVAAILRSAPVEASQQDIDRVASQLSATKPGVASNADIQAMSNALRAK
ncbi:MAG: hypothetical protein PHG25_00165 [Candidatus Pacebacteria bacterium]|nr:hypothetical protein [Candidatus Paceibacterota bacterium]